MTWAHALLVVALSTTVAHAQAQTLNQWAGSVLGFSSQYGAVDWGAKQALGAPDTPLYADQATAWAPEMAGDAPEFISVGFAQPVYATGGLVREVFGNGFVVQIDAIDTLGVVHTVWTGTDTSQQGTPADFVVNWEITGYLTKGLTIHVDTARFAGWEEIDAIELSGSTAAVPEPGSWALMAAGLVVVCLRRQLPGWAGAGTAR
jgi:hypothetical protein